MPTQVPLPMSSSEAARILWAAGMRPDMVYVDASHDALDVLQDLEHFWFLLRCGGILYGDDYHWPQVRLAVDTFACQHNVSVETTRFNGNLKWIAAPKACW